MACSIDSYALLSLEDAKSFLGLTTQDIIADCFSIYHDESDDATACTVKLDSNTLTTVITTGANAGTDTEDLTAAAHDTVGELTAVVTALDKGYIIKQHARDDVLSSDLQDFAVQGCFGASNEQVILYANNCLVIELINIVSDVIQALADRQFKQRTWTEMRLSHQDGTVQVQNFPINSIDWVSVGSQRAFKIKNTSTDAATAFASINYNPIQGSTQESHTDTLELTVIGGTNNGTTSITLTDAANDTLTELVAVINATGSGWSATLETGGNANMGAYPSDMLIGLGGLYCLNTDVWFDVPQKPVSTLDPNFRIGRFRVGSGGQTVHFKYTGGYATIPDDIRMLALEILKDVWDDRKTTSGLKREKLGDYEYERFNMMQAITQSASRMQRIAPYRNDAY